jgi:hypothetical protein
MGTTVTRYVCARGSPNTAEPQTTMNLHVRQAVCQVRCPATNRQDAATVDIANAIDGLQCFTIQV